MSIYREKTFLYEDPYTDNDYLIEVEYKFDGEALEVLSWKAMNKFEDEILIKDKELSEEIEEFVFKQIDEEDLLNYHDEYQDYLDEQKYESEYR